MQASQIRAYVHGRKEKGGGKVKQGEYYCNICGTKLQGGKSDGENMWCSKCRGDVCKEQNRKYTSDTVYLVCKWHAEGMSVKDIALLLKRSKENVQRALDEGSKDPRIAAKYTPYLIPKTTKQQKRPITPETGQPQKQYTPPKLYSVYDKINKRYVIQGATTAECAQAL